MKIYGIKNCNTVQKTLTWLKEKNVDFEFHDYKKSGITKDKLSEWARQSGWEALLNKKGTTWKQLDPAIQQTIVSEETAFKLMQEKTSVIKRPVTETNAGKIVLGFDEELLSKLIQK